jgi:periplasmic divalent cation tolerance protein
MLRIYYIPCPDRAVALQLARSTVDAGHAACAQVLGEATSVYRWDGKLCEEPEYVLILKTPAPRAAELESFVKSHHPYALPALISWEASANAEYLHWAKNTTAQLES